MKNWRNKLKIGTKSKSISELQTEILRSDITSVLVLLQAEVDCACIKAVVEERHIKACRKVLGLKLLSDLTKLGDPTVLLSIWLKFLRKNGTVGPILDGLAN